MASVPEAKKMDHAYVSKFVGACKDHLHAEWALFKTTGRPPSAPVCLYSAGGPHDYPIACLESVAKATQELDRKFRENFKVYKDRGGMILSHEVMIEADGSMALLPERRSKSEVVPKVMENLPLPGGKPKKEKPQTPEQAFMGGVVQVSNYMLDHAKRINEACFVVGNMKGIYLVLASAALVKCRLVFFKEAFKAPNSKSLTTTFDRCNECVELMNHHLLNYHTDVIRTSILHDTESSDWASEKPYQEGEKVSLSIQMWVYYMQGLRHDLWRYSTPKMAEIIFTSIYVDCLELLVTRYSQIEPSDVRMPQFRGDINTILYLSASLLPSLVKSPRYLFEGRLHDSTVFPVHRRLDILVRIAAVKCAPIESLAEVFGEGVKMHNKPGMNVTDTTRIFHCPDWLTVFNPELFPHSCTKLSSLPDEIAVYLVLMTAASKPVPNHALIIRGLMMKDCYGARIILRSLQNMVTKVHKGQACNGALCIENLCNPPILPHTVFASIVNSLLTCTARHPVTFLMSLIGDNIRSGATFDAMDRSQVWNIQRPPWHHCLVQLIAQRLGALLSHVFESVPKEPPAQPAHPSQLSVRLEHHLSAWTLQLIKGIHPHADEVIYAVASVADYIMESVPPSIKPAGGHVIVQLVMNALYSLVNSRSTLDNIATSGPISDGQWDMMQAIGERLCAIDSGIYDENLKLMVKNLLDGSTECTWSKQTDGTNMAFYYDLPDTDDLDDYTDESVIESVTQEMADKVLSSVQGKHSLTVLWEYLKSNMTWLAHVLGVPPLLPASPVLMSHQLQLSPPMYFEKSSHICNPLYFYNHVMYGKFDQKALIALNLDYESLLSEDLWLPSETILELISRRYEVKEGAILSGGQRNAVSVLKSLF